MALVEFPFKYPQLCGSSLPRPPRGGLLRVAFSLCGSMFMVLLLWASSSRAESVVLKRGHFHEDKNNILVSLGFREMFDERLKKRLTNGFTTTVVMRIYLYKKRGEDPIAFTVRTLRANYDIWEEQYLLRAEDYRGRTARRFKDQKKIVDRLTSLWRFPIASRKHIKPNTKYFVAVIAEVNPISRELLSEVRRWLCNPHGAQSRVGSENFFGSFVSIFVNNEIRRAEKTMRVRTQPFIRRP